MARILPDRSATPKRVREYLAQTLTANHDVPLDRATELALRWEYGRGSDLRDATDTDLIILFPSPLDQYLFNAVREDEYLEWRQSTAGVLHRYATVGAISALILSIAYAYNDLNLQTSKRVLQIVSIIVLLHWTLAWAAPFHISHHFEATIIVPTFATLVTLVLWAIWLIQSIDSSHSL